MPPLAVPLLAVLALLAPTSAASGTSAAIGTTIPSTRTSCVPDPLRSAHAFTGTVASTSADGRVAQVRTDDGRDVQVAGSPNPRPNTATSVDRSYATGTRYEFHPLNPAGPHEDTLCTATREVAAAPAVPPEPPATTVSAGAFVTALVALGVVVLVGTAAAFLVPSRRRRNRRRRRRA
ncbi:hypothetical protein [Pseudonocardia alni]|uniref:Uncharacterized protein n=1 Tax=Pseudonocardia alni TaxID=33907 RepID=A0AA44UKL0_PSEA5|nr:hypothetical protein [Pseudonocardia alni]PKB29143.1 hypothetical protein ATL51_0770 [Pseudonocardia alni]